MRKFSYSADEIYNLLPSYIRQKDAQIGGSFLKSIIEIIAEQVATIENNIDNLYDNWFIETCDDWVIPYIGDLVGFKGYLPLNEKIKINNRALVANTFKYRHNKGAINLLEQLSKDVTGWTSQIVEFFKLVNVTENINYLNTEKRSSTVDFRNNEALGSINTPFNNISHSVDIKGIADRKDGFYNIKNIGIFLWRLKSFPVYDCPAFSFEDGKYSFSQIGHDIHLFNYSKNSNNYSPSGEADFLIKDGFPNSNIQSLILDKVVDFLYVGQQVLITGVLKSRFDDKKKDEKSEIAIIDSINLSEDKHYTTISFKDKLFYDYEIETIKINANIDVNNIGKDPPQIKVNIPISIDILKHYISSFYAKDGSRSIKISIDGKTKSFADIIVCDLSEWISPFLNRDQVAIDPANGRILLPNGVKPKRVVVSYYYGFSKEMGGGFYKRPLPNANEYGQNNKKNLDLKKDKCQDNKINDNSDNEKINPLYYFISKFGFSKTNSSVSMADENSLDISMGDISKTYFYNSITSAIKKWENDGKHDANFLILDSEVYNEDIKISIKQNTIVNISSLQYQRPVIKGSIRIAPESMRSVSSNYNYNIKGGQVILDGLLIDSDESLVIGNPNFKVPEEIDKEIEGLSSLLISHCTIVPRKNTGIDVCGINSNLVVILDNSICGRIDMLGSKSALKIKDSIIDGFKALDYDLVNKKVKYDEIVNGNAVQCFRILEITNSTIFGKVHSTLIDLACNSIFTDKIKIKRSQTGCIRFCYIPKGSIVPNRFKCQPDDGSFNDEDEDDKRSEENNKKSISRKNKTKIIKPIFTSDNYGHYGYAQLDNINNSKGILEGAENGSEMGVFNSLFNIQKEKILKSVVKEYSRAGMEVGIFTVT